jgi:hypothetical protein
MVNPKDKETKKGAKSPAVTKQPEAALYEKERAQFKSLLLSNPNYFGNLKDSKLAAVLQIQSNTAYEEIGCVGFQPQFNRLEAVVFVKQQGGYSGPLCSNGSQEYVRFYLSYDNGATWLDQGVTSFTAYDIPHPQRLEYAVTLDIKPKQKVCSSTNIVLVRAILSWSVMPPPNSPNFPPIWGEVHNTHILIDPLSKGTLSGLLKDLQVQIPDELSSVIDMSQEIQSAQPEPLSVAELQKLYANTTVDPHRYAMAEVNRLLEQPLDATQLADGAQSLLGMKLDPSAIADQFSATDGNTTYEELECVGLNPKLDTLVGTVRVKLPNGYSGNLCAAGSREYVAFWADFNNNGTFETYLGTTSVVVHDVTDLPKEGLEYAVFLPVDFTSRRRPCQQGPVLIRIRAVLSWNTPPSNSNPDLVPFWGNREDTLVHVRPGPQIPQGTHLPIIQTVGGMSVALISNVTGLANGDADTAGFTAIDSPFGDWVFITGRLTYPTNSSAGAAPLKYKVSVSADGGATWQDRTDTFSVGLTQVLDGVITFPSATQSVDADNYYQYREDLTGGPLDAQIFINGNILYKWNTSGLSGLWKIKIEAKDPSVVGPVFNSNVVTVRLDNTAPALTLNITSPGGNCADFTIGDQINGSYSAFDAHLYSLSLVVEPTMGGKFTAPPPVPAGPPAPSLMPLTRRYPVPLWTGEAGNFTLDTTGMPRCGYIIRLSASDRTIVNSGFVGRGNSTVVGLCLREKGK